MTGIINADDYYVLEPTDRIKAGDFYVADDGVYAIEEHELGGLLIDQTAGAVGKSSQYVNRVIRKKDV